MNELIEKHLGNCLTAAQVADLLHCSVVHVYKNYQCLGGVKIGKSYRFFEKRLIDAVLGQTEKNMDCSSISSGEKVSIFSINENKSKSLGDSKKERVQLSIPFDKHSLVA